MKKSFLKVALSSLFAVMLLMTSCLCFVGGVSAKSDALAEDSGSASSFVLQTDAKARAWIKTYYEGKGYTNVTVGSATPTFIKTFNLSQTALNNHYASVYSTKKVAGTCSKVAATIISFHYRGVAYNYSTLKAIFNTLCNYSITNGYYSSKSTTNGVTTYSGTPNSKIDTIINYALDIYSGTKALNATSKSTNVYNVLKTNVGNGRITEFNIDGHSMVGAGYIEYPVTYKYVNIFGNTVSGSATCKMAIVCDGWSTAQQGTSSTINSTVYSYFPECKIGSIGYFNIVIA
ncbi:MAG: hypothetical protein PUK12_03755 [Clostridiales bacterium]|nr:hypothetical protein [Clostridiales bacterium]MDY5726587.1 hypothetical protein [Eubacteriales bacterium]